MKREWFCFWWSDSCLWQIYVYALRNVFNQRQLLFFLRTFTRNIWESLHFQGHEVIYYKILQIMHILTLLNFELWKKNLCSLSGYIVKTMWPSTDMRFIIWFLHWHVLKGLSKVFDCFYIGQICSKNEMCLFRPRLWNIDCKLSRSPAPVML